MLMYLHLHLGWVIRTIVFNFLKHFASFLLSSTEIVTENMTKPLLTREKTET